VCVWGGDCQVACQETFSGFTLFFEKLFEPFSHEPAKLIKKFFTKNFLGFGFGCCDSCQEIQIAVAGL
jgi:hypothetical protein